MPKLTPASIAKREALLDEAEDMYVKKSMSIEDIVSDIRGRGRSITIWRLCERLHNKGIARTPTETLVLQRKNGLVNNECCIKGCTNTCIGRRKYCNICIPDGTAHRAWLFYGITHPQMLALLKAQGGVCAGCKCVMVRGRKGGIYDKEHMMCVDHDHVTNQIRGLLCHACNRTLGYARDNANTLRSLATYLEATTSRSS
jgi:hypothetical protein